MTLLTYLRLYGITVGRCRPPCNDAVFSTMQRLADCQAGHASDPDPQEFGSLSLSEAVSALRALHDEAGRRAPHGDEELAQQAGWAAEYGWILLRDREATSARIAAGVAAALAPKGGPC